jgi:hypothetical protein
MLNITFLSYEIKQDTLPANIFSHYSKPLSAFLHKLPSLQPPVTTMKTGKVKLTL